jgi:hypothetical protein
MARDYGYLEAIVPVAPENREPKRSADSPDRHYRKCKNAPHSCVGLADETTPTDSTGWTSIGLTEPFLVTGRRSL